MQVVCIQAHGTHVPGDLAEVPDGAAYSPVHFAGPGSPDAHAAHAAGKAPALPPKAPAAAPAAPKAPDTAGGAK